MSKLIGRPAGLTDVCLAAVIFLALTGCSAAGVPRALGPSGVHHTIPFSSDRAPDPTATPAADGQVPASQASLAQLWAITQGDPPAADQSDPAAWGMPDFADAITTRCYPQLTADESADLTARYTAFLSAQKAQPLVVADLRATKDSYFDEATDLCM